MYDLDVLKERFLEYCDGLSFEDEDMINRALDIEMPKTDYDVIQYAANNPELVDEAFVEYIRINIRLALIRALIEERENKQR